MKKIVAKKSLGQNFLNNQKILDRIIEVGNINQSDNILEIGPGTGNLTEKLLNTKANIIAVEKDQRLKPILIDRFNQYSNFKLIIGDIKTYYQVFLKENNTDFKIIANIPYYLSSFLFRLFFENNPKPQIVVLMIQKELAERISDKTKQNNKLKMFLNLFFDVKYVATVTKGNFYPVPKVDSAIVSLKYNQKVYSIEFIHKFEKIINAGFRQPRKMLISNLKSYYKKDIIYQDILKQLNISLKARPEELDFQT